MSQMNRKVQDLDGMALDAMGRSFPSQGMDFAFNQPRGPFGQAQQGQPFQQPGQRYNPTPMNLPGRASNGPAPQTRRTFEGVSYMAGGGFQPGQNPQMNFVDGNGFWDEASKNLRDDMSRIQGAGDRMFDRGNQNNQGMADLIGSVPGRIEGVGNREADRMDQFAQTMEKPGGQGQQDFDLANKYAADAVSTQQRAEKEYQDTNAQTMASTSEAISRSYQAQEQQIQNSNMTPEEKQSAMFQLKQQKTSQVAAAMAPLVTRGQEMLANLKNNLAQTQMSAGQTALGAGQGRSNSLAMAQRAREFSSNMRQAAVMSSAQLEMQGRTALSSMIRDNPETVVSRFQGLMALYGANKAYGPKGFSMGAPEGGGPRGLSAGLGSRLW